MILKKISHFAAVASFLFTLMVMFNLLDNSIYTSSGLWKDILWACFTSLLIVIGSPIISKKIDSQTKSD